MAEGKTTKQGTHTTAGSTPRQTAKKVDAESAVLEFIAKMPEPYRGLGERLHARILASAPDLTPRLWYGAPGYAKGGKVLCFFRLDKHMSFGLTEDAHLFDEGASMEISSFALRDLTAADEERIGALVQKAVR